ncbi:hypothetical protein [Azospirillum argentinense]|uniref:hypothetical protein n=1 Tax=Azospirillum argentinense TaxID=2970906 RepID=UPI0032DE6611
MGLLEISRDIRNDTWRVRDGDQITLVPEEALKVLTDPEYRAKVKAVLDHIRAPGAPSDDLDALAGAAPAARPALSLAQRKAAADAGVPPGVLDLTPAQMRAKVVAWRAKAERPRNVAGGVGGQWQANERMAQDWLARAEFLETHILRGDPVDSSENPIWGAF